MFPIKHIRRLDLLDGTPESPQEHCHKSRRTLMSLQKCEIAWGTPNQIRMKPDSPALAPDHPVFHIIDDKWLDFLQATSEIP